jgi:hypothetical protein
MATVEQTVEERRVSRVQAPPPFFPAPPEDFGDGDSSGDEGL